MATSNWQPALARERQSSGMRASIRRLASLWNWKSALLSMVLRVPVFAVATMRRGTETMVAAIAVEGCVCAFNAGWSAAVVQVMRNRKPVWLVAAVISVVVPVAGQVVEYQVHSWNGTPHRLVAVIVSTILGGFAQLFNWYAMKQGTWLVGGERSSFGADMKRFPVLLGKFLWLGPGWVGRWCARVVG